jgi:DNA-directed RNA polymerase specialized sigma24 family protein
MRRLSMRKVREVLRLHFECGCKHREIAAACSVSAATVCDYLSRAEEAELGWGAGSPAE